MKNFFLIIILLLLISMRINVENFTEIPLVGYLSDKMSLYNYPTIYKKNEIIEITQLQDCSKYLEVNYNINTNTINNDSKKIHQDMKDPLMHTMEIDGKNYNLLQVQFKKSPFSWNGRNIGLCLHLVHTNYQSNKNIELVIPLDLAESVIEVEPFVNVYYKRMDDSLKQYEPEEADVDKDHKILNQKNKETKNEKGIFNLGLKYKHKYDMNKYSINNLIGNYNIIPSYECCKNTVGQIVTMKLCDLVPVIRSKIKFYMLLDESSNILYVTEPVPINEELGLRIRNEIENDDTVYLKELIPES
jgi:hypothetical protein